MPEWLEDEPAPQPLDTFFMRAFDDLNTCRHDGGPIPWRDIMVYGKEYVGMDALTLNSFVQVMREMDRAYLDWHQTGKKQKVKKPKAETPQRIKNRARRR